MKYTCIESEYLVALLKCALKNEDVPDVPVGLNWEKLVKLSNEQQVYSTIAPVINKINIPVEQAQELTFYTQNELVRMIAMKNELEQIEKELDALKIDYMLLKGSVIKLCYPKQKMRQMSDVDILYHEKDRERLVSMMKKEAFCLKRLRLIRMISLSRLIIPLNGTEQYLTKGTNFILILTFGREQSKIKRNHQNIILTKAIYLSIQLATLMTIIAKADLE